jgi:hypothetical protein
MCTALKIEPDCRNCHAGSNAGTTFLIAPNSRSHAAILQKHSHLRSNSPSFHMRKTSSMNESQRYLIISVFVRLSVRLSVCPSFRRFFEL